MKLSYVELSGFRGYRGSVRIEFAEDFTIIDGRNGVGKSTIFDAIEFALTGELSKYGDAKSLRESVRNYVWWTGEGEPPAERFVEVGFFGGDEVVALRRTPLGVSDAAQLQSLVSRLCDLNVAPSASLSQLCTTSIIRDEQITDLSLDMGDTDRYTLLRHALGASDADTWITRAATIAKAAEKRVSAAEADVVEANSELSVSLRRVDEIRGALASDEAISKAAARLHRFAGVDVSVDRIASPTREAIARVRAEIAELQELGEVWRQLPAISTQQLQLQAEVRDAEGAVVQAAEALDRLPSADDLAALVQQTVAASRHLVELVALGRTLGLQDGNCPLCGKAQTQHEYEMGLEASEEHARILDAGAPKVFQQHEERARAVATITEANRVLAEKRALLTSSTDAIATFQGRRTSLGFASDATPEVLSSRIAELRARLEEAEVDLRVIETVRLSPQLEGAQRAESAARTRLEKAQERFGRTRKAQGRASALHDAARRAAAETLEPRLERVLPLMSELYRRLRPHPVWDHIEYSIRGDVRRFLKLQVGNGLNPQYMFSSGQRRVTGLAFLMSVNLSLAWSRWRSILFDDPVQHIDDFRSVHLAEVLAQLVAEGRQIVCAVEDPALADMIGRRMPARRAGCGTRITLGPSESGDLSVRAARALQPLTAHALVLPRYQAAG